jgi:uncharacterized protein YjbI with pentapeptide repeats
MGFDIRAISLIKGGEMEQETENWLIKFGKPLFAQVREIAKWTKDASFRNPLVFLATFTIVILLIWITGRTAQADNLGFKERTYWDWMKLLLVPIALTIAGYWFSTTQKMVEQRKTQQQERQNTLEKYFDRMTKLLLDGKLAKPEVEPEVPKLARALTLNVLKELDSERNRLVVQFLQESELIGAKDIVDLKRADLSGVQLEGANLVSVNLSENNLTGANLSGAWLAGANLWLTNLEKANLSRTWLNRANLDSANLSRANLCLANLEEAILDNATLTYAILDKASMQNASLVETDLRKADLNEVYLLGATEKGTEFPTVVPSWVKEQLLKAIYSPDTIMPGGSRYEDWIMQQQ